MNDTLTSVSGVACKAQAKFDFRVIVMYRWLIVLSTLYLAILSYVPDIFSRHRYTLWSDTPECTVEIWRGMPFITTSLITVSIIGCAASIIFPDVLFAMLNGVFAFASSVAQANSQYYIVHECIYSMVCWHIIMQATILLLITAVLSLFVSYRVEHNGIQIE